MTDEEFFAWLDGELHGEDAERVAAAVAASPELHAKAEAHRALQSGLRGAFDSVGRSDVPPPTFGADVIPIAPRRAANQNDRWKFGLPQWGAIAASLVLGLVASPFLRGGDTQSVVARDGKLVAAAELERALDTHLASADQSGAVRIGMTFRDKDGQICRTFSGGKGSGLACHASDGWTVDALFASPQGQATDYRMAAGENPQLASLIDSKIAGEPMDAGAERAAKDAGWR